MPQVIATPIERHIKNDNLSTLKGWVKEQLDDLVSSHRERMMTKLAAWDRVYRGAPKESIRSFPWENASNVVIQVVGQQTDTLTARIQGSIWELEALWPIKACGIWDSSSNVEEKREAIEQYLQNSAYDPCDLGLYPVEQLWFSDAIKYGFKTVKVSHETVTEQRIVGNESFPLPLFTGLRVDNVNYNDFLVSNTYKKLEDCPVKVERLYLTKQDLEKRAYTGKFSQDAVDELLTHAADDTGVSQIQREENSKLGINSSRAADRWHVYEVWCKYFLNGATYSLIVYYHLASDTYLGGFFNFLPNNADPYIGARLGYRTSDIYGLGFCELLEHGQEEVTAMHNRRNDNATIANMRILRISPKATRIGANFKMQPYGTLRADKDEVEGMQLGDVYPSTFQEEELLLRELQDRSGTAPAVAGQGAGTVGKKGTYSSQGTFALMVDGNRRVNLDTMDMRYAHVKLGKTILDFSSYFKVPPTKLQAYGLKQSEYIKEALEDYAKGKFALSVRAATAAFSREVERQNDILISSILERHNTSVGQLLQSILTPSVPSQMKDFLVGFIATSDKLMTKILRNFGYENPDSFVPKPDLVDKIQDKKRELSELAETYGTKLKTQSQGSSDVSDSGGDSTGAIAGESEQGVSFSQLTGIPGGSSSTTGDTSGDVARGFKAGTGTVQ